jgi:hypothetical protein
MKKMQLVLNNDIIAMASHFVVFISAARARRINDNLNVFSRLYRNALGSPLDLF